jgi:hypothetical protein
MNILKNGVYFLMLFTFLAQSCSDDLEEGVAETAEVEMVVAEMEIMDLMGTQFRVFLPKFLPNGPIFS